jgi:hypothetical protein
MNETEKFIRDYAISIGLNPDIVMQVVLAEGGRQSLTDLTRAHIPTSAGDDEVSIGPLQLNMKRGLGARALEAGIDARDPKQAYEALKFGLNVMRDEGLGAWAGWKGDKWAARAGKGTGATVASPVAQPMTADVKTYGGTQGIRGDAPSSAHPVGSDLPSQQYALVKPETYGGPDEGTKPGPGVQISSDPAPAGGPLGGRVVARGVTETPKVKYQPSDVPEQPEYRITPAANAAVSRGEPITPANPEAMMAQKQQLAALLAQLNGRPMQGGGGYGQV